MLSCVAPLLLPALLPVRVPAWAMPLARVGPRERFASSASVRNRFVSFIDFTFIRLRQLRFLIGPHRWGETRSAGAVPLDRRALTELGSYKLGSKVELWAEFLG